ncbi:ead/Ea22-like family protein [Citrobacter freundii]|uniref:ead/Ea22-like family protein n=1 Tax=Citrobacter freundii TaxID=546 RepID=UPI002017E812|nr:ead/Ea22-like family protein [Citrobacter freundii]WFW11612.1 ead/Ea22-like family protein [Citrobacter freundii]
MTALNKQALIAKIKKQTESFDTVVLKEDEANALLGELESQQTFQQAFFRQSLMYDVVAEAYEEAKEQIAKDVEIKSRLCLESNSLFDRLRSAKKRIAELEARVVNLPKRNVGEVMHMSGFSRDYAEGWCAGNDNAIHEIRAAGIGVKGE